MPLNRLSLLVVIGLVTQAKAVTRIEDWVPVPRSLSLAGAVEQRIWDSPITLWHYRDLVTDDASPWLTSYFALAPVESRDSHLYLQGMKITCRVRSFNDTIEPLANVRVRTERTGFARWEG
jgi:hypothetical protein